MDLLGRHSNSTLSHMTTNPITSTSTLFPPSLHPSDEGESNSDTNTYITNDEEASDDHPPPPSSLPEPLINVLMEDFEVYDFGDDEWSVESIRLFGAMSFGDWIGRHPVTGKCTAIIK